MIFFFQAEDGIRDLVRSRGLGDVYKRQVADRQMAGGFGGMLSIQVRGGAAAALAMSGRLRPVSYTHLTLPTSDLG